MADEENGWRNDLSVLVLNKPDDKSICNECINMYHTNIHTYIHTYRHAYIHTSKCRGLLAQGLADAARGEVVCIRCIAHGAHPVSGINVII